MKKLILLTAILLPALFTNAQIVNIPDANFKTALVADTLINTNQDTEIQVSEAIAVNSINVLSFNISDLTGIEAFTNLTFLGCADNNLTTIDVSSNINLTYLDCGYNQLTTLGIGNNISLDTLSCANNNIVTIDFSNNINLTLLWCFQNQLSNLDVSNNINLKYLYFSHNQLNSLDVSNNANLLGLGCEYNLIDTLDLSNNLQLNALACRYNQIRVLDLSNNPVVELNCSNNQLSTLNVRNGENTNCYVFNALNNPNLYCIKVDDAIWSSSNWTDIDSQSYYSESCNSTGINENQVINLNVYPNPTTGIIRIEADGIEKIEIIDLHGKQIYGGNENEINLSLEPDGIYIIKVITDLQTITQKLIKQ